MVPAVSILLICVVFLLPVFPILSGDTEGFSSSILSTVLHARAIAEYSYPFWTSDLGFGMPQPFAQSFLLHPVVWLFSLMDPADAMRLFYLGHLLLGATAIWGLCCHFGGTRRLSLLGVVTYVLSATTLNYVQTDFWPSIFLSWSLLPVLFYFLVKLIDANSAQRRAMFSLLLGLFGGLILANGHLGFMLVYGLALMSFGLLMLGDLRRIWPWVCVSLAVCLLLAAGKVTSIYLEYVRFVGDDAQRVFYAYTLFDLKSAWALLAKPLWPTLDFYDLVYANFAQKARIIWFGGIFVVLAAVALFRRDLRPDRHGMALAVAAVIFLAATNLPRGLSFGITAWYFTFRDPLTIVSIVLAVVVLTRLSGTRRGKVYVPLLAAIHVVILVGGSLPFWLSNAVHAAQTKPISSDFSELSSFATQMAERVNSGEYKPGVPKTARFGGGEDAYAVANCFQSSPLIDVLRATSQRDQSRVYLSRAARSGDLRSYLQAHQNLCTNSLAYHGIRTVNGWFKGVNYGLFYPNKHAMHGQIRGQQRVIENQALLDTLGIGYVLAVDTETVAQNLMPIRSFDAGDGRRVVLFRNATAWAEAVVVSPDITDFGLLPRYSACDHDRLLCANFEPIRAMSQNAPVISIKRRHGRIHLALASHDQEVMLFVSEYFLPGWTAHGRGEGTEKIELDVFPLVEGFVGIRAPAAIRSIDLKYQPTSRVIAELASWLTLAGTILAVIALAITGGLRRRYEPSVL